MKYLEEFEKKFYEFKFVDNVEVLKGVSCYFMEVYFFFFWLVIYFCKYFFGYYKYFK